jgi:hypothetical protein
MEQIPISILIWGMIHYMEKNMWGPNIGKFQLVEVREICRRRVVDKGDAFLLEYSRRKGAEK